ncbi:uncharacterized protein LOC123509611 [Portunus trituberculatus]|uniref:uncharacterized protein LOC123509611 n=1 Tax=Portunus trituberculatus TaxID=210409 RepID=UPI001E1CEBAD|nr:uncharacterized protein LOC123509611 [Portunus trituberculatus]
MHLFICHWVRNVATIRTERRNNTLYRHTNIHNTHNTRLTQQAANSQSVLPPLSDSPSTLLASQHPHKMKHTILPVVQFGVMGTAPTADAQPQLPHWSAMGMGGGIGIGFGLGLGN